jgi:uncharacterized protein
MSRDTLYEFDWHPAKAQSNRRDHGITFELAATVFLDALALTVYDPVSSMGEERWFTLGCDAGGQLVAVAHTYEDIEPGRARIRIISARKATRRERRSYEKDPQ